MPDEPLPSSDVLSRAQNIKLFLMDVDGTLCEESLELYRGNLGTKILGLANPLGACTLLNEEQGNLQLAKRLWEEARQLYGSLRVEPGISECDAHISKLRQT